MGFLKVLLQPSYVLLELFGSNPEDLKGAIEVVYKALKGLKEVHVTIVISNLS
jgi:hypothetical protein